MQKYYNSFNEYLRALFGSKVRKVPVNAGMTCPNRDGTLSHDGCIFCDATGSAAEPCKPEIPIATQIKSGKLVMGKKGKATKFLAYFQALTNTYGDPEELGRLYRSAVVDEDMVGLIIGTRPDCVSPAILDILADIAGGKYVQLEYGLQSVHDDSLAYLNRRHSYEDFARAYEMTRQRPGIKVGAHVILGIAGESESDMLDTARTLSDIGIDVIKIHQMHVLKGTRLHELYMTGEYTPMSADEYVTLLVTFLERLSGGIVVDRLIGGRSGDLLVAPKWSYKKLQVLNMINNEFEKRGTKQGCYYKTKA